MIERHDAYILANAWQSVFIGIPCIIICFWCVSILCMVFFFQTNDFFQLCLDFDRVKDSLGE